MTGITRRDFLSRSAALAALPVAAPLASPLASLNTLRDAPRRNPYRTAWFGVVSHNVSCRPR